MARLVDAVWVNFVDVSFLLFLQGSCESCVFFWEFICPSLELKMVVIHLFLNVYPPEV